MTSQSKSKRHKSWLVSISIVILIFIIGYLNFNKVYVAYAYLFKIDHFNAGDKMYANQNGAIGLCRIIRPLTDADIDTMQVSDTEKLRLQLSLKDLPGPYFINVEDYVSTVEKSNYIGKYIGHEFLKTIATNKKMVIVNMLAFKPNAKAIGTTDIIHEFKLPHGYTWANNTYYLYADIVSNKETFKAAN